MRAMRFTAFFGALCLSASIAGAQTNFTYAGWDETPCGRSQELSFVCGLDRPEDLVRIPGTHWLVVSGFNPGAGLRFVDTHTKQVLLGYSGDRKQIQRDAKTYSDCASPPDPKLFNVQGISLRARSTAQYTLYAAHHGGRESIEIFTVEMRGDAPSLAWNGCVLMPEGLAANSVASFSDGTILASVLLHPGASIADFVTGKPTGGVYEWTPGRKGFRLIPGTELPGNNGIETARDDKSFYVVAFGWHAVVAFSRANPGGPARTAIAPGFMPDNIHWDGDRLIAAGMQLDEPACGGTRKIVDGTADDMRCHRGYTVAELNPETLELGVLAYATPNDRFNGASTAAIVDDELWLASYQANRIAYRKLQPLAATGSRDNTVPPQDPLQLDSGLVSGKLLPSGVRAYRGIPFAAPPVRELRWREPQPAPAWPGVYHADRFAPECVQALRAHDINHYFGEEATSEDCLYLNVWAPSDASPDSRAPVVVWIYGGGFTIGSTAMANYSGETLASKGVVYVSMAYRLGAPGFLAHPDLAAESPQKTSGNYGLLDQIAALRWVQRNIQAFGGDPNNVTIMGQSAGSMSVSILQASPLAHGLFARAVGMSGGAFGETAGKPQTREAAEQGGVRFQKSLKAENLGALRNIPADRILSAQLASADIRFAPSVDGHVLPATPEALFAAKKQSEVPLFIGFTRDDLPFMPPQTRLWAQAQRASGKAPVYVYTFTRVHPYAPGVTFADHDPKTVGAYHSADVPYWLGTFESLNLFRTTRDWTALDRRLSDFMSNAIVAFARTGNPNEAGKTDWPPYDPRTEKIRELGDVSRIISFPALNKGRTACKGSCD